MSPSDRSGAAAVHLPKKQLIGRLARWTLGLSLVGSVGLNLLLASLCMLLLDDPRAELRERQLANHQAVLDAIVASDRVRAADLEPHLAPLLRGEPAVYDGDTHWSIDAPRRAPYTTDFEEVEVVFDGAGNLTGVWPYKP